MQGAGAISETILVCKPFFRTLLMMRKVAEAAILSARNDDRRGASYSTALAISEGGARVGRQVQHILAEKVAQVFD